VVQYPVGPTFGVFKYLRRKCCLCYDIRKRLDFLVSSDKDEKLKVPSHSTFTYLVLAGRKRTHHCSKRVGDVGPDGVANLPWNWWVICKERS